MRKLIYRFDVLLPLLWKISSVKQGDAGVHQTVSAIIKTMEIDEAVKFLYSQRAVKNRRLEWGEIVSPLEYIKGLWFSCLISAESLLCVVGSPKTLSQLVLDQGENEIHIAHPAGPGDSSSELSRSYRLTVYYVSNSRYAEPVNLFTLDKTRFIRVQMSVLRLNLSIGGSNCN
jgi:hypothetical protein